MNILIKKPTLFQKTRLWSTPPVWLREVGVLWLWIANMILVFCLVSHSLTIQYKRNESFSGSFIINMYSGAVGSWNISESLKVNMMPVIIISICGIMFIISIIVAIIVISHRVMSSSSSSNNGPRSKQSPASHHHLLYDQVGHCTMFYVTYIQ